MPTDPLQLQQIERWMQSVISHPDGAAAGVMSEAAQQQIPISPADVDRVVTRSKSLTSLERLQIYGNAYYARLVECLRDEFPAVAAAVGAEAFDAFAMGYLQSYPSQSYTLARLGANFPRFLAETQPDSADQAAAWGNFLVDLATLERIYSEVFDGPGSEGQSPLAPADLEGIPPEAWPEVKLIPVPSLRLEAFRFPVHEYITAVRHEDSATIPAPAATCLAIVRRDFIVRRVPLSRVQFDLLSQLLVGQPLGGAIALALENADTDFEDLAGQLQAWFHDWTAWQFFARVELPTETH